MLRSQAKPTHACRWTPNKPPRSSAGHHFAAGTITFGESGAGADAATAFAAPPHSSSTSVRDSRCRAGSARRGRGHVVESEHLGRLSDGFSFQTNVLSGSSGQGRGGRAGGVHTERSVPNLHCTVAPVKVIPATVFKFFSPIIQIKNRFLTHRFWYLPFCIPTHFENFAQQPDKSNLTRKSMTDQTVPSGSPGLTRSPSTLLEENISPADVCVLLQHVRLPFVFT